MKIVYRQRTYWTKQINKESHEIIADFNETCYRPNINQKSEVIEKRPHPSILKNIVNKSKTVILNLEMIFKRYLI